MKYLAGTERIAFSLAHHPMIVLFSLCPSPKALKKYAMHHPTSKPVDYNLLR